MRELSPSLVRLARQRRQRCSYNRLEGATPFRPPVKARPAANHGRPAFDRHGKEIFLLPADEAAQADDSASWCGEAPSGQ